MIAALAKGVGKLALLAVSLCVISGVTLLLFGSYLLTWPMLRMSPRNRKVKSMIDLTAAAMAALAALQPEGDNGTERESQPLSN